MLKNTQYMVLQDHINKTTFVQNFIIGEQEIKQYEIISIKR